MAKNYKHTITRDRYWTNDELVTLFRWMAKHEKDPKWRERIEYVRITVGTGARVNELANLRLIDCHVDGVVILRCTKSGTIRQTKITPEQLPYYRRRLRRLEAAQRIYLFPSDSPRKAGEHITTKQLRRWWNEICAAAGVRNCKGPHGGRHTYATWEIASRRRLPSEVQQSLGHRNFQMTADFYAGAPSEWAYQDGMPPWFAVAAGKEGAV